MPSSVEPLAVVTDQARAVVERIVWCTVTTISPQGEPRSRLMHPVWFDPAMIWPEGPDSDDCGFLRFSARRIVVTPAGRPGLRWSA